MALTDFHNVFQDSIRWRLTSNGVEIENGGVERTKGAPLTATRIWETYGRVINTYAEKYRVPCALIVATICTESGGDDRAYRRLPGYTSDDTTPDKVKVGLMQMKLLKARQALQRKDLTSQDLLEVSRCIEAGTAYIAMQARVSLTLFDPPVVAAAYNADTIAHQTGAQNRWKLRQEPIGTGKHCDTFIRWFNDSVAVLAQHPLRPAVPYDSLLGTTPPQPRRPAAPGPKLDDITFTFGENARPEVLSAHSIKVLKEIMAAAGLKTAMITSTLRDADDQARAMYNNLIRPEGDCKGCGVAGGRKMYASSGNKVIDVFVQSRSEGKSPEQIKADMAAKIRQLGPSNVSHHCQDPKDYARLNVVDIGPKSVANQAAFEKAAREAETAGRVEKFLSPRDSDPAFHLEIRQPAQ
ncbi:MAG: transglycosylase SLT domain-containing protein [Chloroflexi bacterium]|nr:transglycosylase SLT domain-containing protein [Chloroflexota bacterium]